MRLQDSAKRNDFVLIRLQCFFATFSKAGLLCKLRLSSSLSAWLLPSSESAAPSRKRSHLLAGYELAIIGRRIIL